MFGFVKKMFCQCDSAEKHGETEREGLDRRLKAAHEQDRQVREALNEKQIDKGLKDTMAASDPVAKY